jgi:CubicO group peptidase (beta-lactamase class C family)
MKARLAQGHHVDGSPAENLNLQVNAGAGALLSTASDLLKFLAANLGLTQSPLSPLMTEMQIPRHTGAPRFGSTAMPWMDEDVYQPPGSRLWGHGGGGFGYLAFIAFDKNHGRAVVVLSNQMRINPSGVGWTLLQGMPLTRENVTYFVREIVGIGLAFDTDEKTGLLRITSVYPKSPAGEARLTPGTLVQSIDGVSIAQKSLPDCISLLRGPEGKSVSLAILAPDETQAREIALPRRKFVTSSQ